MNVFCLDQQPLLRISEIFIHCCLALLVEAALQVWAWKMWTSIPAFDNYPFNHLDRLSEEDSLWDFPYVIIFALVCLSVSFGNEMALTVWTNIFATSIAKSSCFLLAPRGMNKTTILLHNFWNSVHYLTRYCHSMSVVFSSLI